MNEQVGSIQPSQLGKFQYTPMTGFYGAADLDNIDMTSLSSYSGTMGMNGSIFSNPAMTGMNPYNPMFGMGLGMGDSSYFDNMKQYQQNWTNYYVDSQKLQRNSDLKINGAMEAIEETAANLKDKINHNEQDQIQEAYQKYLAAVKNAYGEGSEEELNSRALAMYTQLNGGTSLVQDLRNNGHTSFLQGFIQSISLGAYGRKSAEDNISEITHQEVPMGEKTEQNVGRVAGFATIGVAAYGATKALSGHGTGILKTVGKFFKTKAGIVSAIVAGTVVAITLLTSKVTTQAEVLKCVKKCEVEV